MTVEQGLEAISSPPVWVGRGFGLLLCADFEMPGLPSSDVKSRAERRCDLSRGCEAMLEKEWNPRDDERVFQLVADDGSPISTLDFRDGTGARLWGHGRGTFFVDVDGSAVRCYPNSPGDWQWRRFLVGQVLPMAALLQGLEILHASGVAIDGQGLVFAGPTRAGKSSVAAHLVLRGADLIADDVVSIEAQQGRVVAHPGTPMIGLRQEERALWSPADLERLGVPIAESDAELLVASARSMVEPCPLTSVYLLSRSAHEGVVSFEEVPDPRYLLASTFNDVLRARERLVRMLDVYSVLSRSAQVFRANVPSSATAAAVAAAVYDHHQSAGAPA